MSAHKASFEQALAGAMDPGRAPEGLRRELMAAAKRVDHRRRTWMAFAAGAVLMLVSGSVLALLLLRPPADSRMAREALTHFMTAKELDFRGAPPRPAGSAPGPALEDPCACWSQRTLGYAAGLPEAMSGCAIQGGRACRVGGRPAACYLLEQGRGLYVFEQPFRQDAEAADRPLVVAAGFQARAWNEGGRGYVIVEPLLK